MPYSARWLRHAVSETRSFWTLPRIAVAVFSPPIGALLWTVWKAWSGWWPIMQVAIISVGTWVVLACIVFFIFWLKAPSQLEAGSQAEHGKRISLLEITLEQSRQRARQLEAALAAKNPHDEHKERSVREALGRVDSRDAQFIWLLLDSGRHNRDEVQGRGFGRNLRDLNSRLGLRLIDEELVRNALGHEVDCYYQINKEWIEALKAARFST